MFQLKKELDLWVLMLQNLEQENAEEKAKGLAAKDRVKQVY